MPLRRPPLALAPDPASVRDARRWVTDILSSLDREDLLDAARLGVSELVTNAVLHAAPPISVSVRGTREHPRIEVHDATDQPPEVNPHVTDANSLLATFGRGISIVASYSVRWGADLSGEGKTVWFEPSARPQDQPVVGDLFDFSRVVASRLAAEPEGGRIEVRLLSMPVRVFAGFRAHYDELARELRLLALAHGGEYPVADALTETVLQAEKERRQARGVEAVDDALRSGLDRVDLTYEMPASCPGTMGRLLEQLEAAETFCLQERMLSAAATPQQRDLQRWYLGEFVRQGAGEPPTPWPGTFEADPQP
jgi:hypothetical protein